MYIFELMYNLVHKYLNRKKAPQKPPESEYGGSCEHVFMPIDSTKKVLACSKCGLLVHSSELKVKKEKNN